MKRKTIALLLALVMCLGLSVPAFAEEIKGGGTFDGIDITYNYDLSNETVTFSITGEGTFTEEHILILAELIIGVGVPQAVTIYFGPGITVTDEVKELTTDIYTDWGVEHVTFSSTPAAETVPAVETVGGFTDVSASSPFAEAINWAVGKNITTGKTSTTFAPSENCTNGQILTFLWRANGSPEPTISNPFTDSIPASFQKAAIWAYEKGLVSGGTFGSSTPCTRVMTVEYLWKAAGSPAASGSVGFSDIPANADYAQAVAWAVENSVTSGTGDGSTFSPNNTCTRGQIVTFLYRAMGK